MKSHGAKPTCYDRLQEMLAPVIADSSFNQWMNAKCQLLGGRKPLDLIIDGKCSEVETAAREIVRRGYR